MNISFELFDMYASLGMCVEVKQLLRGYGKALHIREKECTGIEGVKALYGTGRDKTG